MSSALSAIRIFQGVDPDELQRFWLEASKTEFLKGETVFTQGDPAQDALLLVEGRFEADVVSDEGSRRLGDIWPGEVVGEAGLFTAGAARSATVIAAAPSACLLLDRELLRRTRGNGAVAALERHMLEAMARRIRSTNLAIEQVWREQRAAQAAVERPSAPAFKPKAISAAREDAPAPKPLTLRERLAAIFGRSDRGER